jgi:hypothetical protein
MAAHRSHARSTQCSMPRASSIGLRLLYTQHNTALLVYTGSKARGRPMQAPAHSPGHALLHSRASARARQRRSAELPAALSQSLRMVKS